MGNIFDFDKISYYNNYIINIDKKDYEKMQSCIAQLKKKYDSKIKMLCQIEKNNTIEFNFDNQKDFILKHKQLLIDIIKDVLKIYSEELKDLNVVFLSGSFARGTNKMSSDVDLHFFYNNPNYNYIYEEIVSYIISRIINKSRDCIDPTFIFNVEDKNKVMVTSKMDKSELKVILKYRKKEVKYTYKSGKKRRFYLQYINSRNLNKLFDYLNCEVNNDNYEWCHCFEIIKGKSVFNEMYNNLYLNELKKINVDYINIKINRLKNTINNNKINIIINSISQYKKNYQSKVFELIYEYVSIVRFILMKENYNVKFLNLFDIYDINDSKDIINRYIFMKIYEYMWSLEKLTVYCHENKINYGLHNSDIINYSTKELDESFSKLKDLILNDLERLEKLYE